MAITIEDVQAMRAGDAFYIGGRKHTFTRYQEIEQEFTIHRNGERTREYETRRKLSGTTSRGEHWTYDVTYEFDLHTITRIVPAHLTRKPAKRNMYAFSLAYTRPDTYTHETNDCTVRALSSCTGISYTEAHAYLSNAGRKDRQGFCPHVAYLSWRGENGASFRRLSYVETKEYATLGQWLKSGNLPHRCIVITRNHALAVVAGRVVDSHRTGTASRVYQIFAFVN